MLNRRTFLKTTLGGLAAATLPPLALTSREAFAAPSLLKKFFPGHYLYATEQTFSRGLNDRDRNLVRDNRNFAGYHVRYSWRVLEPSKGNYDFSLIQRDLNTAKADGKKLIVQIHDRNHTDTNRIPVPEYLRSGAYDGGIYTAGDTVAGKKKLMPKLWVPAVAERQGELLRALGAAFDGNETLAQVALLESALPQAKDQPGFTSSKLRDGFMTIHTGAATGLKRTIFGQYVNWRAGMTEADAETMMRHLASTTKNGFGGPDALAARRPFNGVNALGALDNEFGRYYRQYLGVAPITMSVQMPSFRANNALTVLNYAVYNLGSHFLSWSPVRSGTKFTIYDVFDVLKQTNGRIISAPPKSIIA
jgi:hypothetical protein